MEKRNLRVSALAEGLSAIGLVLAIVTVISPYWGRFSNEGSPNSGDLVTGYFGLWTICKDLPQGRSFCGLNITAFNLSTWTFIAGVVAVVSVIAIGLAALLGVCLLLMLKTQERVCLPYRPAVVARLVLSALAALLSTVAIALASIRTDERLPYALSRGWTFYLQMLVILSEVLLTLTATYELMLSRRLGGDPTFYSRDPSGSGALTYSNPSFKDDSGRPSGMGGGRPGSGMGGGRPGSSNGSSTSNSSINTIVSASSVRSAPNGKQASSNGSRIHNAHTKSSSTSGKSPASSRASPKRPTTGRLANGAMIRAAAGRGSQRSRSSGHGSSRSKPTIAVTASSAHPYSIGADGRSPDSVDQGSTSSILNGSFGSIESSSYGTTSSIISGSSVSSNPMALSPRKSSLKKPRPRNEVPASPVPEGSETGSVLGFQNPGFGENRAGSIKRVRIASQSTDV
ncbi:uncharacterized protein LOC130687645 [Daphnia carinata]|uniref:uncharacterized protein LOC130687645 n=1 Tax=Daphnia carinata TaxID=120202 RepID=UPI00257EA8BC|nr:uncharacterized protein LOC130687645 [Daphnia carinata]